ncbi:DUF6538 domain-containing protein [Sphingosinithalassobacter sp. LHW66-3]|uniref:DUF6538 domain-containing protein n=1 Tax=Sphingosinithalassobacter sp. LHW66-3 TaxID=3424718 RepID=UPI003D6B1E23
MCTYLTKRGATYYFRRVIPAELRPALAGKSEFMLSLRTKDRAEAKRRIPQHTSATDVLLEQARARSRVGSTDRESTVDEDSGPRVVLSPAQEEQARFEEQLAEEAKERWEARTPERAELRRRLATFMSVQLSLSEQAMRDLLREREQAIEEITAKLAAREKERLASSLPPPIRSGQTGAALLDTVIVDRWAAERRVEPKSKDAHAAVARWFYERAGRIPVNQITRRDVLSFKDRLIAEGQTAANTNTKLSRLRTILQWAVDNEYAEENVAVGISVKDVDRAKNKRREFDLVSLNSIFSSPVFAKGERPAGGKGEAAYWLPTLALFTGARLEELGQLRVNSVVSLQYPDAAGEERTGWFIRLREDKEAGTKLKNAASERDVPVHPELLRLGFLSLVQAAKDAAEERLFPRLRPNVYGRLTAKWGEWFSLYLRGECCVEDKRMVFHSFRHTFKHYARHVGIPEGVQRQIMGHSAGDVADQYGSGYSLFQLEAGMKRYHVPGLRLPEPWQRSDSRSGERAQS